MFNTIEDIGWFICYRDKSLTEITLDQLDDLLTKQ